MRLTVFTNSNQKVRLWLRRFITRPLRRFFRLFTGCPIVLPAWPYFVFFYFPMPPFGKSNKPKTVNPMAKKTKPKRKKKKTKRALAKGEQLGRGGQATVYATTTPEGEEKALKIYHSVTDRKEVIANITRLIRTPRPSPSFIWPEKVYSIKVKGRKRKTVAIQMDLLSKNYRALSDIVDWECNLSIRTLLLIAFNLALAIEKLHAAGMYFCDLSLANVYFHETTGAVMLIDTENITANATQFLGTPGCMAPEIANGTAPNSQATDWMSLAILIFSILVRQNPFHGIKLDSVECRNFKDEFEILSQNPVYIFDPIDRTNPLVDGHPSHRLFAAFPTLHRAFERSFVSGLRTPTNRLSPISWLQLLSKTIARITVCECGAENIYSSKSPACWNCLAKLKIYGVIQVETRFAKHKLIVCENASLYPHHVSVKNRFDFTHRLAVCRSFNRPRRWPRLHNLSTEDWLVPNTNLKLRSGQSVSLRSNQNFFLPTCNVRVNFRRS